MSMVEDVRALRDELRRLTVRVDELERHPLLELDYAVVRDVEVTTGNNVVSHGLGKPPRYVVILTFEAVTNQNYPTVTTVDSRFATLSSSGAGTLDLLFMG